MMMSSMFPSGHFCFAVAVMKQTGELTVNLSPDTSSCPHTISSLTQQRHEEVRREGSFAVHPADRVLQKLRARRIAGRRLSAYSLGNTKTAVDS
jgi:hypothetical protein